MSVWASRPGGGSSPVRKNPTESRARILDAAINEFAARGFAGARIGRIAKHAGINRAMLYYYFGHKRHLFSEVLRCASANVMEHVKWDDAQPLASLIAWCRLTSRDSRHLRLLEWATLEGRRSDPPVSEPARAAFASIVRLFGDDTHARHKAWLLVSAATLPLAWPQLTQMLVGESSSGPSFVTAHARLLEGLTDSLAAVAITDSAPSRSTNAERRPTTAGGTAVRRSRSSKDKSDG